jgi:hypothetical protein
MIGSTSRPIDTTRINGSASTQCTITTGTGIACTSDERVKTNITDLSSSTLDNLLNVRTVTYNWTGNPTGDQQIGFLAQNLEQYFPQLVATDRDGMKSVYYAQMTPILVQAIRELDVKIEQVQQQSQQVVINNQWSLDTLMAPLRTWFADIGNGIGDLFADRLHAKQEICIDDVCVTKIDLETLIQQRSTEHSAPEDPVDSSVIPDIIDDSVPVIIPDVVENENDLVLEEIPEDVEIEVPQVLPEVL